MHTTTCEGGELSVSIETAWPSLGSSWVPGGLSLEVPVVVLVVGLASNECVKFTSNLPTIAKAAY